MRNAKIIGIGIIVLALATASGCAKRQLTRSETDRLDAVAAKIAEAERIGAPDCIPYKEIAIAKVEAEHARHEMTEIRGRNAEYYVQYLVAAEKAADSALAKAKDCMEAKKPVSAAPPPPPPPAAETPPPAPPEAVPEETAFRNIHFDFDKSFIREDAKPELQAVATYMRKNRDSKILIEGHCDERGTAEYNMALGDRRASSAKKYLVALGIDGKRISTISYGKERPLDPAHNEEAWASNRRAVFDKK